MDAWRRSFTRRFLTIAFSTWTPALLGWFGVSLHAGLIFLFVCVLMAGPLVYRSLFFLDDVRANTWRIWLTEVPMFVHGTACFLHALACIPLVVVMGILAATGLCSFQDIPWVMSMGHLAVVSLCLYGTLVRRFWIRTRTYDIRVPGLPATLDGFRIAHISDIHCGPHAPRWWLSHLARRVNATRSDVITVTGDMITMGCAYVDDVEALTRELHAPEGVFAIMGNHDYYSAVDDVPNAMSRGGARVLRNESTVLAADRGGVFLAGIDDNHSRRGDVGTSLSARSNANSAASVVLVHDPNIVPLIRSYGRSDLILSGHTHAGQVAMPLFWRKANLARLRFPFHAGLYSSLEGNVFVHSGVGTSGPPIRVGVAPEVVVLVLRCAG